MSNKTPAASAKKTKSEHRTKFIVFGLLFLAAGIIAAISVATNYSDDKPRLACTAIGSSCIDLELANTNALRVRGLSGRESIGPNQGMLFVFDAPNEQCMWMKDMKFSIDILWLDNQKKITKIEKNLAPDTFPQTFCADQTLYVVELHDGTADRAGLKVGDYVKL